MEPWQIAIVVALLIAVPALCAAALRAAGAAGYAVLAGVIAGVLLGPTIFGRVAPNAYESLLVGGVEQREELETVLHRHGADLVAAEAAGYSAEALAHLHREHAAERSPLDVQWNAAKWDHQRPLRAMTGIVVAIALVSAGRLAIPKPPSSKRQQLISPLSIGLWAAVLPGALAYLVAQRWWGWTPAESAIVAAAVMIGPWALTRIDREAADQAERGGAYMVQTAGRFASLIALALAVWGILSVMGIGAWPWIAVLGAAVVGWALPAPPLGSRLGGNDEEAVREEDDEHNGDEPHAILSLGIMPTLAALATLRIELFEHFAFWPILILLILSGDGRWLGALIGALFLGGRSGYRTMRLVLGSMACGPTQLAIVAIAAHLWLVPDQAVMALVIGALVIEVSAPLRRSMARRLTEAEEWELE